MRTNALILVLSVLPVPLLAQVARADDALYRCQSADGNVSVQSQPCPKGDVERKIPFERPPTPAAPTPAAAPTTSTAAPPVHTVAGHPVAPPTAIVGPNDPYPLWQCMRADGSTFDSRDGVPGRQWVPKTVSNDVADAGNPPTDEDRAVAEMAKRMKKGEHVVHAVNNATTYDARAASDPNAPPAGAAPGQWVSDQCVQLDPEQACDRFAARRDALRKQIYAARPSDRALYAPEEQDLTTMLYATCNR